MFIVEKFASTINIVYICRTIEIVVKTRLTFCK